LEATLALLEANNIEFVRTAWQKVVLPKIAVIEDFATNELRFIGSPLEHVEGKIKRPDWIKNLLTFRQDFEESLNEKNANEIDDLSRSFHSQCFIHLGRLDAQLWSAINLLDQLTTQVLGSRSDGAVRP